MFRKSLFVVLTLCSAFAGAQTPAKDVLKAINQYRSQEIAVARKARKPADMPAIQAEMKARAEAAIKGIELGKVEAKDALDWAQLFQLAGRHKEVCDLTRKYLATQPTADDKFAAQMLIVMSCNELGEGSTLAETLMSIRPTRFSVELADGTVREYIDTVKKVKGTAEAIKVLDAVQKSMPTEDPKVVAQRMLQSVKKREAASPTGASPMSDEERLREFEASVVMQYEFATFSFLEKKAQLLAHDGQKQEAYKVLSDFISGLDPKSDMKRSAEGTLQQLKLEDAPAPALAIDRGYGTFKGLDSLKGKVVILDFFAHWCGPCIASFPELKKLLADNQSKGLEIIGVTSYYGYYKGDNFEKRDMARDAEYGKMAEFIADHNLTWPVVFGERSNFEAYGVVGIPHVVVIDRQGVVRRIKVGNNPAGFADFKALIEKLLAE
jgi:thiol-disulfide isomerase/thioredoxin